MKEMLAFLHQTPSNIDNWHLLEILLIISLFKKTNTFNLLKCKCL